MDIERLVVKITADASQYTHVMQAVEARLVAFSGIVSTALVGMSVRLAAQFERAAVAFEVMIGDATKASKIMQEVVQMALETPFHSSELIEAAKQLRAFGFASNEIMPVLRALANVSSGTGAELSRVSLAFGQVRVAGRLMGAELRQFINAGVPLIEELAAVLEKPRELIASMVHEGQIGWPEVVRAFNRMTQAGGLYAGMNERINRETVSGQWEQFTESLQLVGRDFGNMLLKGFEVREMLRTLSSAIVLDKVTVNAWTNAFNEVKEAITNVVVWGWGLYRFIQDSPLGGFITVLFQFGLALRGISIATGGLILAWRGLMIAFNISGLMRVATLLTGIILRLWGAVAATLAWAASLLTLNVYFAAFLAVMAAVGAILVKVLSSMSLFDSVGSIISQTFKQLGETFSRSWEEIKMAIEDGNIELAASIAFKTLEVAWAKMIAALKAEWFAFWASLSARDVVEVGNVLGMIEVERMAKVALAESRFATGMAIGGAFFADPQIMHQMKNEEIQRINKEAEQRRAPLLEKFIGEMNTRRQVFQPAIDNQIAGAGARQQKELDALYGKRRGGGWWDSAGSLMAGVMGRMYGTPGSSGGIPNQLQVGSLAKQQAEMIQHELIARGQGPYDLFRKTMANLTEAREGKLPGLFGLIGGLAPETSIMDEATFRFGSVKAFDELRRSIGTPAAQNFPAAAFRGSQAAQDSINRSMAQSTTIEQDILATLREAKEIQSRQVIYQEKAATLLQELARSGVIVIEGR